MYHNRVFAALALCFFIFSVGERCVFAVRALSERKAEKEALELRVGAVLGSGEAMNHIRRGYDFLANFVNSANEGKGMGVRWLDGEDSFLTFDMAVRDNGDDETEHERGLLGLLGEGKIDFLFGSKPPFTSIETRLAGESHLVNVQCCTDEEENFRWARKYVFGVTPSVREFPAPTVRSMALKGLRRLALINSSTDKFARMACSPVAELTQELQEVQEGVELVLEKQCNETDSGNKTTFLQFAQDARDREVEGVVACLRGGDGAMLVAALHEIQYPLKSLFLTDGPGREEWLDKFPLTHVRDILSATHWHPKMKLRDNFFKNLKRFRVQYKAFFNTTEEPTYDSVAAVSSGLILVTAIRDVAMRCNFTQTPALASTTSHFHLLHNETALSCSDGKAIPGYERIRRALEDVDVMTVSGHIKFDRRRKNVGAVPVTTQVRKLWPPPASNETRPFRLDVVLPLEYASAAIKMPASNPYIKDCFAGYYVGPDEFDPCIPCPPGKVSRKMNRAHCDSCNLVEWVDEPGQKECKACPEGTHVLDRGAVSIEECVCRENFYHPEGEAGQPCLPCPKGAYCAGGDALPIPNEGHWTSLELRSSVYECDPASNCLGGEKIECAKGYTGRLCADCKDGYFQILEQCIECISNFKIILCIVFLMVVWYMLNVVISGNVASLDMVLGFAQLANIIGDVGLRWPTNLETVFGIANILDFDVDILEPTCMLEWNFSHNLYVQLLLPLVMGWMASIGYLASWVAMKVTQEKEKGAKSPCRDGVTMMCGWMVSIPDNKQQLKEKWDCTIAAYLSSIEVTFVTVTKYCFDAFKCEEISGTMVLGASPDIECGTRSHKTLMGFAVLGILVYSIGYVVFICYQLQKMRANKSFSDPTNIRRYGFLYRRFEPDYFWMSAVISVRRLAFVAVLVFMNSPAFQAGVMAVLTNASLMLHVYTAPYVDTYLDILFSFLLVALMFETFGGLMFFSENLPGQDRQILEWIVLSAIALLGLVFLVIFAKEIIYKYEVYILKRLHRKTINGTTSSLDSIEEAEYLESTSPFATHKKKVSHELLETFDPGFLCKALVGSPQNVREWDKLTDMLKDYMSDQSETSYLSMENVAKFWRKLVDRFPELVDFLAITDDSTRMHFAKFANALYTDYYLKKKVDSLQIFRVLNWRDRAALAQWLAQCDETDRRFFTRLMAKMFKTAHGDVMSQPLLKKMETCGRYLQHTGNIAREVEQPPQRAHAIRAALDRIPGFSALRKLVRIPSLLESASSQDPYAIREEIAKGHGPLFHSASMIAKSLSKARRPTQSLSQEEIGELALSAAKIWSRNSGVDLQEGPLETRGSRRATESNLCGIAEVQVSVSEESVAGESDKGGNVRCDSDAITGTPTEEGDGKENRAGSNQKFGTM
ncbi:hypothetical protein BSKO_04116 [Bryopsis sp. KO-2023]|nr:hypothetical protein BSKO_04116 [Bryopsis sp. KO-2023]